MVYDTCVKYELLVIESEVLRKLGPKEEKEKFRELQI
jgi:hypothetical protein